MMPQTGQGSLGLLMMLMGLLILLCCRWPRASPTISSRYKRGSDSPDGG